MPPGHQQPNSSNSLARETQDKKLLNLRECLIMNPMMGSLGETSNLFRKGKKNMRLDTNLKPNLISSWDQLKQEFRNHSNKLCCAVRMVNLSEWSIFPFLTSEKI